MADFRAAATPVSPTAAATTGTITVPAGVTTTDYGIIVLAWAGSAANETTTPTATGWASPPSPYAPTGCQNMGFAVLVRNGGQVAGDTIPVSWTALGGRAFTLSAAWYDNAGQPLDVAGPVTSRAGASSLNSTVKSVTTTAGNELVIAIMGERSSATGTTPSSWTSGQAYTQDAFYENGSGSTCSVYFGHATKSTAGATGDSVLTYTGGAASGNSGTMLLAMQPATVPATAAGTATLTLSGSGSATPAGGATGTATLTLTGSGAGTAAAAGTATLTLSGVGSAAAPAIRFTAVTHADTTFLQAGLSASSLTSAQLIASTSPSMTSPTAGTTGTPSTAGWASSTVTGLTPGTTYYLAWRLNGGATGAVSHTVKTLQTGPLSYVAATASCQTNDGDPAVFAQIAADAPAFFSHQGDIHYADTSTESTWRAAFTNALTKSRLAGLNVTVPFDYVYDNHDWAGQGSSKTSWGSTTNPATMVRELSGSYPAATTNELYRTWVHGRVRWIKLDQWTERDPGTNAGGAATDKCMSAEQEQWLYDTLTAATEPVIVLLSAWPMYSYALAGRWQSFPQQTARIKAWVDARPAIRARMVAIGGDSHSIQADSGANQNALGSFPTLNASAILQNTGDTSGTWDVGNMRTPGADLTGNTTGKGVYSRVTITDSGGPVLFKWEAVDQDGTTQMQYQRTYAASATGTAVLTLTGTGSTAAPAAGTATLALAGSGAGVATAAGIATLALTGTGAAGARAVGTAGLTLTGSGTARTAAAGTATLTLAGSSTTAIPTTGAATLTLTGTGAVTSPAAGTATIALTGTAGSSSPAAGTATLTLTATGNTGGSTPATGTAVLTLTGTSAARAAGSGAATITLTATAAVAVQPPGTATLTLTGTGTAATRAAGSATIVLTGNGTGRTTASGAAHLILTGVGVARSSGGAAPTPLERTFTVKTENRVLTVHVESRTFAVPAENRLLEA